MIAFTAVMRRAAKIFRQFKITRQAQDEFSLIAFKGLGSTAGGRFDDEIMSIVVQILAIKR